MLNHFAWLGQNISFLASGPTGIIAWARQTKYLVNFSWSERKRTEPCLKLGTLDNDATAEGCQHFLLEPSNIKKQ
jgi:hypothetical protein